MLRLTKLVGLILSSSMNCTDPEEQVAVGGNVSGCYKRCGPEDLGEEDDLHLKMISSTSLCEMGSSLNGMVVGCGSQVGLLSLSLLEGWK